MTFSHHGLKSTTKKKKKSLGYFDEYSVYIWTNFCLSVVRYERLQQIHMKPKSAGSLAYN